MSEYVEIKSSPAEIINIALGMAERGRALAGKARTLGAAIEAQENNDRAYPSDDFSDTFLKTYKQQSTDSAGKTATASDAVRDSAVQCGETLGKIGEYVNKAMMNYGSTDDDSGADIDKTKV